MSVAAISDRRATGCEACERRRNEDTGPSVLDRHPNWVYWGMVGLRALLVVRKEPSL